MERRRTSTVIASLMIGGLLATACASGGEDADPSATTAEPAAGGADDPTDGMTDDELAVFLNGLSDEEFDEYTADLTDDEYKVLLGFLESFENGETDSETNPSPSDQDEAEQDDDTSANGAETGSASDATAQRDDVDCSPEGLGDDQSYTFTAAHYVVDGALGEICLGEADDRLVEAWDALATITPSGQLADLGVFTGFESAEDGDEITLAFVNALDADGSLFQMSVNLETYAEDPSEAQMTMAHEFGHVFTSLPSQLDRTVEGGENCETYDNGEGCYLDDSIMYQWTQTFWGDGLIEQIDPLAEATAADGQARCDTDPGFFGAYAASSPEEDFAESFSVYVFDVETLSDEQRARIDWIAAQPGLAEFRDRAEAAGLTGLANNFDGCGVG